MRPRFSSFALLVLIGCSSGCFEDNRRAEKFLAQSITQFHEQLNDEHYHDIYLQADAELRSRLSEADFTVQLSAAHGQLGKTTNEPLVFVNDQAKLVSYDFRFLCKKPCAIGFGPAK